MKKGFGSIIVVLGLLLFIGSINPECTGNVVAWLEAHPTISNAIVWEDPGNVIIPYVQWSDAMKSDFHNYFQIAWNGGSYPLTDPPPNILLPPVSAVPDTAIAKDDAWHLYLSYVANSLAVEMKHKVPWSLLEYTNEDLAVLFDSRTMFTWKDDLGFVGFSHKSGYYIENQANPSVPAPPDYTLNFLNSIGLASSDRFGIIAKLVDWSRQNITHMQGDLTSCSWFAQFNYLGLPPVSQIIGGVPHCSLSTVTAHYTFGCHGTSAFFKSVLRAVNIPTFVINRCHFLPYFPTEGLYLAHGDDPYGMKGAGLMDLPIEAIFINQATFDAWFGSNVSSQWCNNNDRRSFELLIKYLPEYLLNKFCEDLNNNKGHVDGSVYSMFKNVYSLDYLEKSQGEGGLDLWGRMYAKDCDDGNACTKDSCGPLSCVHTPYANGTSCADNSLCIGTGTCQNGICTAITPVADGTSCADHDLCNGAETCQSGICMTGTPIVCNDNNPCTSDRCNPETGACVFTSGRPRPDLVVLSVSGPATGVAGSNITVSVFVDNQGNADIIGTPITSAVYLSTDTTISPWSDTKIADVSLFPFMPASSGNGSSSSATIPAGLTPGTYWIGAIADAYDQIAECSESNNTRTGNTIIVSSP